MRSWKERPGSTGRMCCAVALGLLTIAAGCKDLPTNSPDATRDASPESLTIRGSESHAPSLRQFVCVTRWRSVSAPSGWESRRFTVQFPRNEIDRAGRTVQYQHRLRSAGGTLRAAADCEAPYTEAALRRLDHRFGIHRDGGADQFKRREEGVSTQGCVTDGECLLEPIVVQPPPDEPCSGCSEPTPPPGYTDDGGGSGGGGGGDGSGTGEFDSPPGGTDGDVPPNPDLPNCASPATTHEAGWCEGAVPVGVLLDRLRASAKRLRDRGGACTALGEKADQLLTNGGLRVTGYTGGDWSAAAPLAGVWAVFKTHMVEGVTDQALDWVIAHEMDHSVNNVVSGTTDSDGHMLKSDGSVDPYQTLNSVGCRA